MKEKKSSQFRKLSIICSHFILILWTSHCILILWTSHCILILWTSHCHIDTLNIPLSYWYFEHSIVILILWTSHCHIDILRHFLDTTYKLMLFIVKYLCIIYWLGRTILILIYKNTHLNMYLRLSIITRRCTCCSIVRCTTCGCSRRWSCYEKDIIIV